MFHVECHMSIAYFSCGMLLAIALLGCSPNNQPSQPQRRVETQTGNASQQRPLPAVRTSPFRNTTSQARYAGSAACVECHRNEHESYLRTAHSRALEEVDVLDEPDDVEFLHRRSGRQYKVYRESGQLRHSESIPNSDGTEFVLSDYPIRYRIGSGHHSRSYLVETDGFLVESPITWYTSTSAWWMSPGYDVEHHGGFERIADIGCVYCHAGHAEAAQGSDFRVTVHDGAISCETCHGPGALHVAHHRSGGAAAQETDFTIVNPAKLTRDQTDAICAQCHLRGAAITTLRGRAITDFRPGLSLADFRTDYVLEPPDKSMSVVGHVEQMRKSLCFQQSETLTCTTCHHPHETPADEDRIEYFRQSCLGCHATNDCGLDVEVRKRADEQDNCVKCHMPQSPTDIPHFAFTHHRIGLHEPVGNGPALGSSEVSHLVPVYDLSHLPKMDRLRGLGLAYLELSEKQASPAAFEAYRLRAIRLLESVRQDGLRDGDVDAALARLYWERQDLAQAIDLADEALREQVSSRARANALFVLGDSHLQLNQPLRALPAFETLAQMRRQSEVWVLLGVCHQANGQAEQAISAFERAVEISPARTDVHQMLAGLYQAVGKAEAAERHRRIASRLAGKPQ